MKATYKGHADFQDAHTAAKYAACYELGPHWKLIPGASVLARLPASWVTHKVGMAYGASGIIKSSKAVRISRTPRDVRLPAADFWENGLPVGPEYFEEYRWEPAAPELAEAAD